MFCCTLLYAHSSSAIILMGKRELVALLYLSSWCLVMVEWLLLAVLWGCMRFVIVVFPDHTHLLFFNPQPTASSTPYSLSENYSHYMENLVWKLKIEPGPMGFSTTGQGVTTKSPLSGGPYTSSMATDEVIR